MTSPSYDARLIPWTGANEGKVLRAYKDPVGVITIGFGFTWGSKVFRDWWTDERGGKLKLGDRISEADAVYLLKKTIDAEYAPPVVKGAPAATPHAKAAAIDMLFNCGIGAAKWSWFKLLAAGKVAASAERFKVTGTTAKGRRLPGLVRRRAEGAAIMEFNRWPAHIKAPRAMTVEAIRKSSDWRLGADDFSQGLKWLVELGYLAPGATGDEKLITSATRKFQGEHPQLDMDGVLGRATLDQLQRVIDLRRKAGGTTAGGVVVSGGGAADSTAQLSGYGDWLLYAGAAFLVIGLAYLAWTYRDEISVALKGPEKSGRAVK